MLYWLVASSLAGTLTLDPGGPLVTALRQSVEVRGAAPGATVGVVGGLDLGVGPCLRSACLGVVSPQLLGRAVASADGTAWVPVGGLPRMVALQAVALGPAPTLSAPARVVAEAPRLDALDLGGVSGCGLDSGRVGCWGSDEYGQATPPPGAWDAVTVGATHACGLDGAGEVTCWGRNERGKCDAPPGPFLTVSAGGHHTCSIRHDGSGACWGSNEYGKALVPADGRFVALEAGGEVSCGLELEGALRCWGDDRYGVPDVPPGRFVALGVGKEHVCAVREDSRVICWGNDVGGEVGLAPDAVGWVDVVACRTHSCALDLAGEAACWGHPRVEVSAPPPGPFTALAVRPFLACGLRPSGELDCWGRDAL